VGLGRRREALGGQLDGSSLGPFGGPGWGGRGEAGRESWRGRWVPYRGPVGGPRSIPAGLGRARGGAWRLRREGGGELTGRRRAAVDPSAGVEISSRGYMVRVDLRGCC
jgi:hypothetical protein